MVSIRGQFCIDRYEASVVDARERELSPYYPPAHDELSHIYSVFRQVTPKNTAPPLPQPPAFALNEGFEPRARSLPQVVPNGYMTGVMARRVCENTGKRFVRTRRVGHGVQRPKCHQVSVRRPLRRRRL